jgi:dTDP-4-dehydrorhamnose reductase
MPAPRILILGSNGGLGRALVRKLAPTHEVTAWKRADLDFERPEAIADKLARCEFDVLLNPAGMTNPDMCETQPETAHLANVFGPQVLAECCHRHGARLIHFSTDYVFSGEPRDLWGEDDPTEPVNLYGRTKREGELAVLQTSSDALVARVSWLFGPDKASHPDQMISRSLQSDDLTAVVDKISAPTSTADVCDWIEHLIHLPATGVLHLCNSGVASWHSWAETTLRLAESLGVPVKTTQVRPTKLAELTQLKALRPLSTVMSNQRLQNLLGIEIRHWSAALEDYLVEKYQPR